jgi:hypothetical protein
VTAPPPGPAEVPFRAEYPIRNNDWTDELIYAIVRTEWAARQAAA